MTIPSPIFIYVQHGVFCSIAYRLKTLPKWVNIHFGEDLVKLLNE